jgi:Lrp/AsnC family leucine-responsive transcriptional regulator
MVEILSMPETVLAYSTTGKYDALMALRTKDFDQLVEKIGQVGKNPHIVDLRSHLIVDYIKIFDDFNPLITKPMKNMVYKERRKSLDKLDLGILHEIRDGANKPLRELADKLNAPISTIKERTDRMEYEGIIKNYVAKLNFLKLGYWVMASIAIRLKGNHADSLETIKEISQIPEVGILVRIIGDYDLHVGIMGKNSKHAMETLHKIARMNGVVKTESSVALEVLKSREEYNPISEKEKI